MSLKRILREALLAELDRQQVYALAMFAKSNTSSEWEDKVWEDIIVDDAVNFNALAEAIETVVQRHFGSKLKKPSKLHKWATPKYSRSRIKGSKSTTIEGAGLTDYCVKCGAAKYLKSGSFYYRGGQFPKTFFAAYGNIFQYVKNIPPCEGLPDNYNPPIGA